MARPTTGNVTVRRRPNGRLCVYVDGVFVEGVTAVEYRDDRNDGMPRLAIEVLGCFVRLENEDKT